MATLGSAPPCSLLRLGRWAGGGMRRLATFPRLWRPCWREAPTATHRKYTHCKRHVKLSLSYPISYNNLSRQGRDLTKYEFKFKCYPKLNIFTILSEICRIPSLIFNKLFFRNLWDCWRNVFKGPYHQKSIELTCCLLWTDACSFIHIIDIDRLELGFAFIPLACYPRECGHDADNSTIDALLAAKRHSSSLQWLTDRQKYLQTHHSAAKITIN